jgi:hypothetical protein
MNKEELAELIAAYFAAHNEIDNLGDGESICFMSDLPTVNVVELAEQIIIKMNKI